MAEQANVGETSFSANAAVKSSLRCPLNGVILFNDISSRQQKLQHVLKDLLTLVIDALIQRSLLAQSAEVFRFILALKHHL